MPRHGPRQREEIRTLTKKSSVKRKNWTEPERKQDKYQSVISDSEGAAGFVSTQQLVSKSVRAVITLVCDQWTLKWLNWFGVITLPTT